MLRQPVVSGRFYESEAAALKNDVRQYLSGAVRRDGAVACLSPHAGYLYSGAIAGTVLGAMGPGQRYIILGPNHTGMGERYGVYPEGTWLTPLGKARIDEELAGALLKESDLFSADTVCHMNEHSIEVQIPILQVMDPGFSFVPVCITEGSPNELKRLGDAVARCVNGVKGGVKIIVSSDMSHYEPQEIARKKDMLAIDKLMSFDFDGFIQTVIVNDISMCGAFPAAVMIQAMRKLGAVSAELVTYATSGEVSGDYSSVVGYAGVIVKQKDA